MNFKAVFIFVTSVLLAQTASAQTWTQQGSDIDGEAAYDLSGLNLQA